MGRDIKAKCKQCRRVGTKLFLKGDRCSTSKCAIVKRNYIPGMHGTKIGKAGTRLTGYGIQLQEKQKAKKTYRILEKQFSNYFKKAINTKGDTAEVLYRFLELRVDNVVFRGGFASSRDKARQIVNHGLLFVNGKKVNIPSYQVRLKDKITIKKEAQAKKIFEGLSESLQGKEVAEWLLVDPKELAITVIDLPSLKKTKPNFDLKAIIEFYSR